MDEGKKKPKIVITQPIGFSDEQLIEIASLGDLKAYNTISNTTEEWLERVEGADIVCSNNYGLDDGWMKLTNVYITYPFVTTAFWDFKLMEKLNIKASNSPGCNQIAVTEWILAMLLNHMRNIPAYIRAKKIVGPIPPNTKSIYGKSVCIIGNGKIGARTANALSSLGMQVAVYSRGDNIQDKIRDADVIVDCLSLNPTSVNFYNRKLFSYAKKGVLFVSISPNETKNHKDILVMLLNGQISHLITDNASSLIFNINDKNYKELLNSRNVTVTPHVAAYSDNTLETASRMCLENMRAYISGNPINLVS